MLDLYVVSDGEIGARIYFRCIWGCFWYYTDFDIEPAIYDLFAIYNRCHSKEEFLKEFKDYEFIKLSKEC